MNCKPGDLAIVVKRSTANLPPPMGAIIRVTAISDLWPDAWQTDPPVFTDSGKLVHVEDYALRPIRDPGDDATDESLLWLPVPTKEKEHA